jgi:hypothetical protein
MVSAVLARAWRAVARDRETTWWFTGVVAVLYLVFQIFMHAHHEMWRDEAHAFSLARIAQSFGELVTGDRRYEGHPPLWFWYLRLWSFVIPDLWGAHVATVVAAVGAAVVLLRFAPFPRYLRVMLLLTYDFGYELTVMCRNYVLGLLLLCAFCALYHPLRPRPVVLAIVLSLLAMTSVYGMVLAVALTIFLVLENVRLHRQTGLVAVLMLPRQLLALAIIGVALAFCAWSVEPMDPNPFSPDWNWPALTDPHALNESLMRFLDGMAPLRPDKLDFWFKWFDVWEKVPGALPWGACALLAAAIAVLYRSWRLMLFFVMSVAMMATVQQTRLFGCPRHWAHYFLAFFAACWLLRRVQPQRRHLPSLILLVALCGLQAEGFAVATKVDTRAPFSGGKEAADFIRRAGMQDLPLVAGPGQALTAAVYLHRPFYNMETEEVEETVAFHARRRNFSLNQFLDKAITVSREHHSPVTVVMTIYVDLPPLPPGVEAQRLFLSREPIVPDERFVVYRLEAH